MNARRIELADLEVAPFPGRRHPKLADAEKAELIFNALAGGERLTRAEIIAETGLSLGQFRSGWYQLRRSLGTLAVVEPHRERSTYRLSNDYSDGAADRYRFWQGRHIYRRLWSHLSTIRQMEGVAARTDAADGENLRAAAGGLRDAIAGMKGELRRAGQRANWTEAEVEAYISEAELIDAAS